jgi:bleomycin hydrolase
MRKNVILMGALLMASMSMMAQTGKGGISTQMIQQMEKSQKGGTAEKALFNAIANNNIDDLVKNPANAAAVDTHFSIETPQQSIHNQLSSGRCWMFSGFNVLRSNFALNDKQGRVVESDRICPAHARWWHSSRQVHNPCPWWYGDAGA